MHPTIVVIIGVYHDNVPAFVDECRYPQSANESSASSNCPWTGWRHGANNVELVVQELEEEQEDWDEEILDDVSFKCSTTSSPTWSLGPALIFE